MKKCADNSNIHAEDKPKHSRQTSKNKEIESYLSTHYDFRFNTVLGRTEFSPKYANVYSKVSRYDINTFRRELDSEEGIITSADNLYSIIESSFSPRINPIQEYFKALPTVDASEVLYKIEINQCAIANLATLTYIGQNLIVNIDDQLKALNKRDENELKNLITCPMVKYRMPYDKYVEEHPHLASFVASVNGNDFLTDPTGSRRFLPFEVLAIDIERAKAISMDAVYTEAKALLKSGFRYWFNDDEIAELYRESEDFQVQTAEMNYLQSKYM